MGVFLVTEGCLDEAIARHLLRLLGIKPVGSQIVRGWREALRSGLHISSQIPHHVVVFIDADHSVEEKLREAQVYFQESGISVSDWDDYKVCNENTCCYKIPLDVERGKSLIIVFWADPSSGHSPKGSVEDVLRYALGEAYACELREAVHALARACKNCPETGARFIRTQEKLLPILFLLACSGGGTLVFSEAHSRCGFNVDYALGNLEEIGVSLSFKKYAELLRGVLRP